MALASALDTLKAGQCPLKKNPFILSSCYSCKYAKTIGYAFLICNFTQKERRPAEKTKTSQPYLFNNGGGESGGPGSLF